MTIDNAKAVAETIQALITATGIIVAGMWALYNFGLTRIGAPRIKIDLSLKSVANIREHRVAILAMTIVNSGHIKIEKRRAVLAVYLIKIEDDWPPLTRANNLVNYNDEAHEILTGHHFLEPDEEYHEEISFVVDDFDVLQAGILFAGPKREQTWEANFLFDVSSATRS